jgi:hypothetical protein
MDRQQNIRQASSRRVGANFTMDGNPIIQNKSGGVVQIRGKVGVRNCGCVVADGIDTCSCLTY